MYRSPVFQYTKDGVLVGKYASTMDAEPKTGIKNGNICSCINGRISSTGGYVWKRESETEEVRLNHVHNNNVRIAPKTSLKNKPLATKSAMKDSVFVAYHVDDNKIADKARKIGSYATRAEAARKLNIKASSVSKCLLGKYTTVRASVNGEKLIVAIVEEKVT